MPKPNTNPRCPHCGGESVKNGRQNGKQRYRCKSCDRTYRIAPRKSGNRSIGSRPMTDAERARKYRARRKKG